MLLTALCAAPAALEATEPVALSDAYAEQLRVGREALQQGDPEQAVEVLERAVELDPERAEGWSLLGRGRYLARRHLGAQQALERAVELGAADATTLLYLASVVWENGDPERAESIYRRVASSAGGPWVARFELGRLLAWQGRHAEAAEVFRSVLTVAPASAELPLELGRSLEAAGDLETALAAFREAVARDPQRMAARYGLARVLERLGRTDEASAELDAYRRLYEAQQRHNLAQGQERARIDYGLDLVRQGRPQAALEHLDGLPETPDVVLARAQAHEAGGEAGAALAAYERAFGLDPGRQDLRLKLTEARLRLDPR